METSPGHDKSLIDFKNSFNQLSLMVRLMDCLKIYTPEFNINQHVCDVLLSDPALPSDFFKTLHLGQSLIHGARFLLSRFADVDNEGGVSFSPRQRKPSASGVSVQGSFGYK